MVTVLLLVPVMYDCGIRYAHNEVLSSRPLFVQTLLLALVYPRVVLLLSSTTVGVNNIREYIYILRALRVHIYTPLVVLRRMHTMHTSYARSMHRVLRSYA